MVYKGCQFPLSDSNVSPKKMIFLLLMGYIKTNPYISAAIIFLCLVIPIQDVLIPELTGRCINAIQNNQDIKFIIFIICCSISAIQILLLLKDYFETKFYPSMIIFIRKYMFSCIIQNPDVLEYDGDIDSGDIISRFIRIPQLFTDIFQTTIDLVPNVFVYVALIIYFSNIDYLLGIILSICVCICFIISIMNVRRCSDYSIKKDASFNASHMNIDDVIHNIHSIISEKKTQFEIDEMNKYETCHADIHKQTMYCNIKTQIFTLPFIIATIIIIMSRCIQLEMNSGVFTSVFMAIMYMIFSFSRLIDTGHYLVYLWGIASSSGAFINKCLEINKLNPSKNTESIQRQQLRPLQPSHPLQPLPPDTMILFKDVSKVYESRIILENINFEIKRGDKIGIIGQMGSGKSTILKMIIGNLKPSSGFIHTSCKIGYIPQNCPVFDTSVLNNIIYYENDSPPVTRNDINEAIKLLNLEHIFRNGFNLDTNVGKHGSLISGGQRQAIWLVRMWLKNPDILILDEPTASIDINTSQRISIAIRKFPTIVLVSHDIEFVTNVVDNIYELHSKTLILHTDRAKLLEF